MRLMLLHSALRFGLLIFLTLSCNYCGKTEKRKKELQVKEKTFLFFI